MSLNITATILGIFLSSGSFILSSIALVNTGRIKRKIRNYREIKHFNSMRDQYKNQLRALSDNISKDKVCNTYITSKIAEEISKFSNYKCVGILKRKKANNLLKYLRNDVNKLDKHQLCQKMAVFISYYDKDMEELI